MADIDQISVLLNKLQSNYTELANKYFDIFFNSTPTDVTLEWYDESGVLQTITVPNRAKDFTYFRNGIVDPEGVIVAPKSTIYQNINTGEVFSEALPIIKLLSSSTLFFNVQPTKS